MISVTAAHALAIPPSTNAPRLLKSAHKNAELVTTRQALSHQANKAKVVQNLTMSDLKKILHSVHRDSPFSPPPDAGSISLPSINSLVHFTAPLLGPVATLNSMVATLVRTRSNKTALNTAKTSHLP